MLSAPTRIFPHGRTAALNSLVRRLAQPLTPLQTGLSPLGLSAQSIHSKPRGKSVFSGLREIHSTARRADSNKDNKSNENIPAGFENFVNKHSKEGSRKWRSDASKSDEAQEPRQENKTSEAEKTDAKVDAKEQKSEEPKADGA
ncbi:hypothetical protein EC988_008556, partial [Linderina pennispora]